MRLRLLATLLPALIACRAEPDRAFPEGFLFGSAVAGFQVDMGCPTLSADECEDRASDWYQFVTDPYFTANEALHIKGDAPSTGPGFYELYGEDLGRAKDELKLGSVRLSIEWSRIFPASTRGIDGHEELKAVASAEGIAYYRRVFEAMRAKGLEPLVTLNHYTMPLWVHDGKACHQDPNGCTARGWMDESTITEIAKYAAFCAREFGDLVDVWATLNEPLALPLSGYLQPGADRSNPPGVSMKAKAAKTVTMNLIVGHARMYDAVKAADTIDADGDGKASQIGLVLNMSPARPVDPDDEFDAQAAKDIFYLYNSLFLNATIKGLLDENADGNTVEREDLRGRMDYLGINYYTRLTLKGLPGSILPEFSPLLTLDPFSSETVLWEDYPRGLYEMLMHVHETYGVPTYVTENGYPEGSFQKTPRADPDEQGRLMVESLSWVRRAIAEGADVRGYYWWTLVDNYEWNHGMDDIRLGLYRVDGTDPQKKRTLRDIGRLYARIAADRRVPDDLHEKFPIE